MLLAERALDEEEAEAADLHARVLDERRLADALAIDVNAVRAVQVGDQVLRAVPADLRVAPGDLRVVQHEVVVSRAADGRLLLAEEHQRGGDAALILGALAGANALRGAALRLDRTALARPLDARRAAHPGRVRQAIGVHREDQQVPTE